MTSIHEDEQDTRPTPDDFYNYLPWACNQLQLGNEVLITKVFQNEYVSVIQTDKAKKGKSKAKLIPSRSELGSDQEDHEKSEGGLPQVQGDKNLIRISAIYDAFDNLVEIKFHKNYHIPRVILKIIALIIKFQIFVTRITINGGLDVYTIYEIEKFLTSSNITEICLDGSFLKEANYDILLNTSNSIRCFSLSRCKINDDVIKNIAAKLAFPSPASMTLNILNFSSNSITDAGAKYLAEALRTNRCLCYLNLADNRLTDTGVGYILDCLIEFPLTCDELIGARTRHMLYLKKKNILIGSMIKELKAGEFDRRAARRKSTRGFFPSAKKGKLDKEFSLKSLADGKSLVNMDYLYYDKAVHLVENTLGEFNDPFSSSNTVEKNGMVFCMGCNTLCYLNLAYNNLTYLSLEKILKVLMFQKLLDRKPRGLINLSIDGNYMPIACKKFNEIDDILEIGLMVNTRRPSTNKKRIQSKMAH